MTIKILPLCHVWGGVLLLLVISVMMVSASPVYSDDEPSKTVVFNEAMGRVASQYKIAIVVENAPLHPTAIMSELPDFTPNSDWQKELKRLANAFDFSVAREKDANVWLLKKRYSDPADLPAVTMDECLLGLQDIERLLAQYMPLMDEGQQPGDEIPGLLRLLTAEQARDMKQNKLKMQDLTPEQRQILVHTALRLYIGLPSIQVRRFITAFRQASKAKLRERRDGQGERLGFDTAGDAISFVSVATISDVQNSGKDVSSSVTQAAVPTTLAEAAKELAKRAKTTLAISPEVSERPVLRFGEAYAEPNDLFRAYAATQGLRVISSSNQALIIKRQPVPHAANFADIPRLVRMALPEPMIRSTHEAEIAALQNTIRRTNSATAAVTEEESQRRERENKRLFEERNRLQQSIDMVGLEAANRLLESFRLYQRATKPSDTAGNTVAVSQLNHVERSVLALCLLTSFVHLMQTDIKTEVPEYLREFGNLVIGGGVEEENGRRSASITLSLYDESRKEYRITTGISNILVP